jgi:hypothetical protein
MLSDERIAELADKYYSPVGNTKYIEQAIKDALAEAGQVPVMGEPVGFILIHEDGGKNLTFHDNTGELPDGWSQHKLIIQPTNYITATELDALLGSERMAIKEASDLAMAMWRDFFQEASPNFGLCDSPAGVLSQIDNMYAGLRERIQLQDARIRELEIAIQEIIKQNHYDFRGHEIAEAAIVKERQS